MKIVMILVLNILLVSSAFARDDVGVFSVAEAMALEQTKSALGDSVSFYFGDSKHGKTVKTFGESRTNKKTNAFNKSDKEACQWVFLSAMVALRDRAVSLGANAVVNIKSNYKNNLVSSNDSFSCGAGTMIAGVALVGDMVTIEK